MAGHKYISDLCKPKMKFKGGGQFTMSVIKGHNVFSVLPISAQEETSHRKIYLHVDAPYDPPTYVNETVYQNANRANIQTPTAFIWHLRYACKCVEVLKLTQTHVTDMQVQQGSWATLDKQLPCVACLAGHMRKTNKTPVRNYIDAYETFNSAGVCGTACMERAKQEKFWEVRQARHTQQGQDRELYPFLHLIGEEGGTALQYPPQPHPGPSPKKNAR
jgi:hypothetical protein